ncbi:hypothetical protein U27_02175 [Candidatus Vecturithrix granuli]|uniref:PsbP C-terminal domain-containing protein n=1 Tax=Vecturithrix granuli TaxID=1499967 RepID=A0A0S6WA00_VECG1|nr:hypothetical protein U27_02175 [Candidatus Vecturithrix granuli]
MVQKKHCMSSVFIAALGLVLIAGAALAQDVTTYVYPDQNNPQFLVDFPNDWTVETSTDGGVTTIVGKKAEAGIVLLTLPAKKVENLTPEAWDAIVDMPLENAFSDLEYLDEPEEGTSNDIEFWKQNATGTDKETGKPVELIVSIYFPNDVTTVLVYTVCEEASSDQYRDEQLAILDTIRLPE